MVAGQSMPISNFEKQQNVRNCYQRSTRCSSAERLVLRPVACRYARSTVRHPTFLIYPRRLYQRTISIPCHGERIGEDGLLWLKAHVAKCADGWNGEKTKHLDLEDRAAWTDANIEQLYQIAEAVERCEPLPESLPKLHDEGVQFLAACLELKKVRQQSGFYDASAGSV